MSAPTVAAAAAWAALYAQEGAMVDRAMGHLSADNLGDLTTALHNHIKDSHSTTIDDECCYYHQVLGHASLRRMTYQCLDKFQTSRQYGTKEFMDEALKHHVLPTALQHELATKYGGEPPQTWHQALQQLQQLSNHNKAELWRLLLDHPMTAYVPVQCQHCGHVIPDDTTCQQADEQVGLQELEATGDELELRAGWFRGPRRAVPFQIACTQCGQKSKWYRSGHPRVILNPHKWGRLCGEQEDLRLTLAHYLDIPLRLVLPLDWDHIWSEYGGDTSTGNSETTIPTWQVQDDSARNFACRLDEGIGSWTRILALHPTPELCEDVTNAYLTCQTKQGRADDCHETNMPRYRQTVQTAQKDPTGTSTQAKTVKGYLLYKSQFTNEQITKILQRAAIDYAGTTSGEKKSWWELPPL